MSDAQTQIPVEASTNIGKIDTNPIQAQQLLFFLNADVQRRREPLVLVDGPAAQPCRAASMQRAACMSTEVRLTKGCCNFCSLPFCRFGSSHYIPGCNSQTTGCMSPQLKTLCSTTCHVSVQASAILRSKLYNVTRVLIRAADRGTAQSKPSPQHPEHHAA